ncbi:MAG TPA: hypothetical protein VNL16_05690 [Chloroflexota bacterium]|nr:hypothetical protein [Chloroflexota bacterium]
MRDITLNRRKTLGIAAGSLAGAALLSACGASTAAGAGKPVDLYLTIVGDPLLKKKDWPAFIPTALTVPANTTVNVRIVNFDDGAAPLPDSSAGYAKVSGVIGSQASSEALNLESPNTPGTPKSYGELAPKDVSHTFTITTLNLNVPLPVSSIVSFSFPSPSPGTYTWQCMAPCGTDPNQMGGAMAEQGYMVGSLQVV